MRVTVIDYFEEVESSPIRALNEEVLNRVFPAFGVRRITADMAKDPGSALKLLEPVDVFTSFDSIEHWHDSPKRALHEMMRVLKPGGLLVIGVPNAVNVRKRITVPLGFNNWSHMSEWYDKPRFFSHVREPVVADLVYIAQDLELEETQILGRNWSGYFSSRASIRGLTTVADSLLRLRPSLCSDLYLVGRKKNR
jgi:SAM-dependent methyltransferase